MALLPALTIPLTYRVLGAPLLRSVHHSISVCRFDNLSSKKTLGLLPDSPARN